LRDVEGQLEELEKQRVAKEGAKAPLERDGEGLRQLMQKLRQEMTSANKK
jgi:hypothetical protein